MQRQGRRLPARHAGVGRGLLRGQGGDHRGRRPRERPRRRPHRSGFTAAPNDCNARSEGARTTRAGSRDAPRPRPSRSGARRRSRVCFATSAEREHREILHIGGALVASPCLRVTGRIERRYRRSSSSPRSLTRYGRSPSVACGRSSWPARASHRRGSEPGSAGSCTRSRCASSRATLRSCKTAHGEGTHSARSLAKGTSSARGRPSWWSPSRPSSASGCACAR